MSSRPRKHKRRKTRRRVRCTICTDVRWLGNNTGRFKDKETDTRERARREIRLALGA